MKQNSNIKIDKKPEVIEVIKDLKPREALSRKDYKEFHAGAEAVLSVVYGVYRLREAGKSTVEAESEAKSEVTAFLHTLGKCNGKFISVCEATTENGITSVLFDTLVYHSFKDNIFTKSEALAEAECDKAEASRKKRETHDKLLKGKATLKEYKEAEKVFAEAVKALNEARKENGAEAERTVKQSPGAFTKFLTARLKAIAQKRFAISEEEAEAERKLRNKANREKRKAEKPEAVKPEEKNGKKPEEKPNGKKTEAKKPAPAKQKPAKVEAKTEAPAPANKPAEAVKKTA